MVFTLLDGESKFIEYKKEYAKSIVKTVSAYANYHDGYIIIGINDDKSVIGVENPKEIRLRIENMVNDSVEPKPFYEFYERTINDKVVVVIKVYKGDYTPYTVNNKAYKRMDTSTVPADKRSYEELILRGRNISFEELPCVEQELEFSKLEKRLRQTLKLGRISDDILTTLNLLVNNKYNNAAALLSDNNPLTNSNMQLLAFADSSMKDMKDRVTITGTSVLEQYDYTIDFYKKHINTSEKIDSAYRNTIEEIPLVAYREAVANAIAHRDYSRNTDIRIEIYDNRVEITSPGGLPIGISEEEYLNGRISVPRNRVLTEILFRLKIIEKLATGVRRIKEHYQDFDVNPIFKVSENSILVVLPKVNIIMNEEPDVASFKMDMLNEKERQLYDYIKSQQVITRKEAEKLLGLKKTQTVQLLSRLCELQIVKLTGSGRSTIYKLNM